MSEHTHLRIQDYSYELPDARIARYPVEPRDSSRLLVYQKGEISHHRFYQLPDLLPSHSFLFFNDTKVIPARLRFVKDTGAIIEIFLLQPVDVSLIPLAMEARGQSTWQCSIGNLKRWNGQLLRCKAGEIAVEAKLVDRAQGLVAFQWPPSLTFAEVIAQAGFVPLPPYLGREAEAEDTQRYQTIYSKHAGAVAAPTAGLHFTEPVLENLRKKGVLSDFLTLHVSAGTFQPVKSENAWDHTMHAEHVVISRQNLKNLLEPSRKIIAVGTTSARTLESLYWFGVRLIHDPESPFRITQQEAYQQPHPPPAETAIRAVLKRMDQDQVDTLMGETSIYLMPGYRYRIVQGLITNFHQPASTLMLLVAALIGPDWRQVYDEALAKDYRFLSYGDSSLLLP
jgi:S-adenosylmethionine:tRNA ribosyltransferase-isomerase